MYMYNIAVYTITVYNTFDNSNKYMCMCTR